MAQAGRALGSPPRAQAGRVGADEVAELVDRFGVPWLIGFHPEG